MTAPRCASPLCQALGYAMLYEGEGYQCRILWRFWRCSRCLRQFRTVIS